MRGIIVFILLSITFTALAQQAARHLYIDSLTYAQYLNEEWKALNDTAKNALKNNEASYWTYIRAATAAAKLNKPYREFYLLNEADKKFPDDALIQSLLYNSSYNISEYPLSLRLNKKIRSDSALVMYYPKNPPIHLLNIETGIKTSSTDSLYQPMLYAQTGLGFRIKTIACYSAFTYLQQQLYYGNLNQYQLYLSASFMAGRNYKLTPILHLTHYNITNAPTYIDANLLSDQSYISGIQISRLHKNFQLSAGVYYSELGKQQQLQIQPGITYFPFSNNKLYLNAAANYITQNNHLTFSGSIGYSPVSNLSLSVAYLSAQTKYFTEQNGFIINNSYDITKDRYMASINWRMFNTLFYVYGIYQYETKTETYYNLPYYYHTGILGIKKLF